MKCELPLPVELYSRERIAEFLLSNATTAADYLQARIVLAEMGFDPDKILACRSEQRESHKREMCCSCDCWLYSKHHPNQCLGSKQKGEGAPYWCKMVPTRKQVRRSVTLPEPTARKIASIARRRKLSDNRVLVELIEEGIESRRQKEKAFFELAQPFRSSQDADEVQRLGEELGRFVFGE